MIVQKRKCEVCGKETIDPKNTIGWITINDAAGGLIEITERGSGSDDFKARQVPIDSIKDFCGEYHLGKWINGEKSEY